MQFTSCPIPGAWLISPTAHADDRGRFFRAWCEREFDEQGIEFRPRQANIGSSRHAGTIRGMHYQDATASEAKLMRCTKGSVFDVIIDLRPESPTWGQWYGVELSAEDGRMLYVPELCAHGYQTLCDDTDIHYLTSAFYDPGSVRGVRFDDAAIAVRWPVEATVVSEQDLRWPLLVDGRAP